MEKLIADMIKNDEFTPDQLDRISETRIKSIRAFIAGSSLTKPETLKKLSKDKDRYVRSIVISNPNTPKDVVLEIYRLDKSTTIKTKLAANASVPAEILNGLASSNTWTVEWALINNLSTPSEALRTIYDKKTVVSHQQDVIAAHPNCPADILDKHSIKQTLNT
jgi:3-methyladenine DNA glycosylase AlkC